MSSLYFDEYKNVLKQCAKDCESKHNSGEINYDEIKNCIDTCMALEGLYVNMYKILIFQKDGAEYERRSYMRTKID